MPKSNELLRYITFYARVLAEVQGNNTSSTKGDVPVRANKYANASLLVRPCRVTAIIPFRRKNNCALIYENEATRVSPSRDHTTFNIPGEKRSSLLSPISFCDERRIAVKRQRFSVEKGKTAGNDSG